MNNTILITGASRGLGFCLVKKYLEDKDIVFAGVRDLTSPNMKELQQKYPETFIPIVMEVTNTESINNAADEVKKYTDKIDILINNAAIHSHSSFQPLEETDLDDCLAVYDVNSIGPIRVVKSFLPFIKGNAGAKIFNISSESGSIGDCRREKEFDYCMSKAALNMGTKLLANYLKKDDILVFTIQPGWMRTDMGGPNAHLDPYENACRLVELFATVNSDTPMFIDNQGKELPW
jgi:NAD(P)-dependent dehydrogenase (short-subunit alcohol dehydrogenase family)